MVIPLFFFHCCAHGCGVFVFRPCFEMWFLVVSPCMDPENFIRGVLSTYFTEDGTDLPREAIRCSMLCPIASRAGSLPLFLRKFIATCDFPGWRGGGGTEPTVNPLDSCIFHISQWAIQTSLEKQLDTLCPIVSQGGSLPVFLWKTIAICDFPGGECLDPLSPLRIHAWYPF